MKSSHHRRRSTKNSQRDHKMTIESILSPLRPLQKSVVHERFDSQPCQSQISKKNKFLIQLPKIYPIHRKFLNLKSKDLDLIKCNYVKFHSKGLKFTSQMDQIEDSTIDAEDMELNYFSLRRKQQSSSIQNIFSELILRINNVYTFVPIKNTKIKAYVQEGNNSRLIKELLRKRIQIKLTTDKQEANLIWTQFSDYNALKRHSKISNQPQNPTLITRDQDIYKQDYQKISQLQIPQTLSNPTRNIQVQALFMHNHLKNHEQLSDKKNLLKNIHHYCQKNGIKQSLIIPRTFHVDCGKLKQGQLQAKIDGIFLPSVQNANKKSFGQKDFFVIKPGQDTNRGEGISVVRGKQNILASVKKMQRNGKSSLIQQYIYPLLYRNRKFDIRCYVLVTSICGQLHAYWYKQGYLRTCCKQFTSDPSNIYGHLTNDAVQKKSKDYGKYEQANKLSYNDLYSILTQTQRTRQDVIQQMKSLATLSIKSAQNKLKQEKNVLGFEIFGFDFLIDKQGKVWLIQINTNPCLEFAGSLLSRIIWHMVDNSIRIAIDPFLDIDPRREYQSYLQLNRYECIL